MRRKTKISLIFLAVILAAGLAVILYGQKSTQEVALVKPNKEYDKRTVVKKSTIPNAGDGLFAAAKIKEGEVIGELGGRLVADGEYPPGSEYLASLAECAWDKTHPYKFLDSRYYGGNVARINFAPSEINGIETNLQNAAIKQICEYPYFIFVALKDIESGAEILSSYGPNYEYDRFMQLPEVRDFFCGLLKIDCSEDFTYSY